MIPWWWLLVAVFGGAAAGVFLAGLCCARGNADMCAACALKRVSDAMDRDYGIVRTAPNDTTAR